MSAYHQGAPRVQSEDVIQAAEARLRGAKATEERKAKERADKARERADNKAAYELMMEEENKPKEGPAKEKKKTDTGKKEKPRTLDGGAKPSSSKASSGIVTGMSQDGLRLWREHAELCRARRMVLWYP
eukprot:scaffold48854_cov63-Phaeocystis_antarctica.AAC.6